MKRRSKGERRAYKKEYRERMKRLKPYKPQIRRKHKCRWGRIILLIIPLLAVLGVAAVFSVNTYVKKQGGKRILTPEAALSEQADCILVLGCLVKNNGEPSHMLEDRLKRAVELYHAGAAPKILMSGDHGRTDYNEVKAMKQYAIEQGIPSEDIFMDHAGFSTYDSCYRAKEIFKAETIIIVTQEYHLYRALYIADSLGVEAYGVNADYRTYINQSVRDAREILARVKDFLYVMFRPEPTYLGDTIPVTGDGNVTND